MIGNAVVIGNAVIGNAVIGNAVIGLNWEVFKDCDLMAFYGFLSGHRKF